MLNRRPLLAAPLALLPFPALAQARWPERTVRVSVGFPPGGSLDVMSRLLAERLQGRLGQSFVVENRSGATGMISAEAMAKAPADGYTIGTIGMPTVLISPHLNRQPFDVWRDFTYVAETWEFPNVAVVPANHVPARSLAEFIAWGRERPGGVVYGSSGVGTSIQLSGAYLLARAGIQGTHVPFRGAAQTAPAMLAGDVHIAVDNLASYIGLIQDGHMRALAVTSGERWPTLPNVPTMAEAGMADFVVTSWSMWGVPSATPRGVVDRIAEEVGKVCRLPEAQERALGMGGRLLGTTPEQTLARLRREEPMWREMVRISGATAG